MAWTQTPVELAKWFRNAYVDFIRLGAMQMQSAASDTVDQERLAGETIFFDGYLKLEVTDNVGNTDDIKERDVSQEANTVKDTPRLRTGLQPQHWEFTEVFDPRDMLRLMRALRPDSQYSRNVMSGFGRRKDRLVIAGAIGDRLDGNSLALVDFPTDGGTVVPMGIGSAAGELIGLTFSKIIAARRALESSGVQRTVPWTVLLHPEDLYDLLNYSSRITSFDFHTARALVSGQLDQFLGMRFRMTTEFDDITNLEATTTGRHTLVYSQDAIILGLNSDVEVHFDILFQQGHSLQVAHYLDAAATRMFGEKIVDIHNNAVWEGTTLDEFNS